MSVFISRHRAMRFVRPRDLAAITLILGVCLWPFNGSLGGQSQTPLPCVPAAPNDPEPWRREVEILRSFPPDVPAPSFLGRFKDSNSVHELDVWRDSKGVFGEWLSPVLPADPPTSRLYDLRFDATSGALSFSTRIPGRMEQFEGHLAGDTVRGTVTLENKSEKIVLRKLPWSDTDDALRDLTTSRAQFECRMILFHRY